MKRFLILSISIVFLTVSCAGPNKVGWTKRDFRQDQFEKDWKECSDSFENLNSEAFGKAFQQCLEKKDYEFKKAEEPPKEPPLGIKVLGWAGVIAALIVLSPLIVAYGVVRVGSAP